MKLKKGEMVASHEPTDTRIEAAKAGGAGMSLKKSRRVSSVKRMNLKTSRKKTRKKSTPAKDWLKKPI